MAMKHESFVHWAAVTVVLRYVSGTVVTHVISTNMSDPHSSFVRQESAHMKLDTLIVMVSKMDHLETKLDLMTNLLKDQEIKNSMLEKKLESMETQQETLLGVVDTKLFEIKNKVEEMIGELESKIETKLEEIEYSLGVKLAATNITLNTIAGNINNVNLNIDMARTSLYPVKCEEAVALIVNASHTSKYMMEYYTYNVTHATEVVLQDMKGYLERVVEGAVNSSLPECCAQGVIDCQKSLSRLEELVSPSNNITKHLIAAVFNRIRVSNLAMDKRLGALLHTSSVRQRILQDNLLAAITSSNRLITSQMQDVYKKFEDQLQGLENSLVVSAKLRGKEIVMEVLKVANYTQEDISTAGQIDHLLHAHANTTHALNVGLDQLQELHNITMMQLAAGDLCVVSVPETSDNRTITYTGRPVNNLLDDAMKNMHVSLANQLSRISDQLAGLRIYYSTSLHMNTQQLASEVAALKSGMRQAVQELAKSTHTLAKLRRSSLGYLDAAVTTVTSAAVASAKATANQLTTELHELADRFQYRLTKLEAAVREAGTQCPPQYTKVGGICLLLLLNTNTTWHESREKCRDLGGDLATIPDDATLHHLHYLFNTTAAVNSTLSLNYWVGGTLVGDSWAWVTGTPVVVRVGDASMMEEEEEDDEKETQLCLMSSALNLVPSPCHTPQAALCQHNYPSHNSYIFNDSSNNILNDFSVHPANDGLPA
ncbi:hypothetical protein OTU49_009137 [Cherax quadricarinatus]|uniref:C-type lectin domain-containing protein n=1 Tax=Cherax quadricarinatus TaxID=27406 RepID=A0AAW0WQH1_CHEQU